MRKLAIVGMAAVLATSAMAADLPLKRAAPQPEPQQPYYPPQAQLPVPQPYPQPYPMPYAQAPICPNQAFGPPMIQAFPPPLPLFATGFGGFGFHHFRR